MEKLLTVEEMAGILRSTKNGVYARVARGHLPRPIKIGGKSYWRKESWEKWLEKQEVEQGIGVEKEDRAVKLRRPGRPRKEVRQ
jgi:predicted DNA-binding transcriptional regulator AlpA